jgi:hypothetical protein
LRLCDAVDLNARLEFTRLRPRAGAKLRPVAARLERSAWRAAETILAAILTRRAAKFRSFGTRLERRSW